MEEIGIVSHFNGAMTVYTVGGESADSQLRELAIQYVVDNAGKNNTNDILDNDTPVESCPLGYVLKYNENKDRISVYYNTEEVDAGWVSYYKSTRSTLKGFFARVSVVNRTADKLRKQIASLESRLLRWNCLTLRAFGLSLVKIPSRMRQYN